MYYRPANLPGAVARRSPRVSDTHSPPDQCLTASINRCAGDATYGCVKVTQEPSSIRFTAAIGEEGNGG
jgi:hypothetical protein